jgi:Rieske Fe-S protein
MIISRREFLLLTAGLVAGCQAVNDDRPSATGKTRAVNAGPVGNYSADGIYKTFREQGFFVIRRGDSLFALSAICTHRKCKLDAQRDDSFSCPCHGSTFDPAGHVTKGPARRDLPILPTHTDEQGRLIVEVSAS